MADYQEPYFGYTRGRKLAVMLCKPALLLAGLLAYLCIRVLEPWRRIRVGLMPYDRIGPLAVLPESFMRRQALAQPNHDLFVFFSPPPVNRALLDILKRHLHVIEWLPARALYNHGLRYFTLGTRFDAPLPFDSNCYYEFIHAPPQMRFISSEETRGRAMLQEMGIPPDARYICFHSRDKAYLAKHHTYLDFSYHDFRDCDIMNYLPAVAHLVELGYYALRMGAVVDKPLPAGDPRIIDYASRFRTDFGDVYFPAHCRFLLGNTSGLTCIPNCFNVPLAIANYTPLGYAPWGKDELFIVKKYRDRKSGRMMTFPEVIALGAENWIDGWRYGDTGIEVVENTPQEILDLALERHARTEGTWQAQPEDDALQDRFRRMFPPKHRIEGYPSRLGAQFLRENRQLLG